jgi:hypothetical protein
MRVVLFSSRSLWFLIAAVVLELAPSHSGGVWDMGYWCCILRRHSSRVGIWNLKKSISIEGMLQVWSIYERRFLEKVETELNGEEMTKHRPLENHSLIRVWAAHRPHLADWYDSVDCRTCYTGQGGDADVYPSCTSPRTMIPRAIHEIDRDCDTRGRTTDLLSYI